jgi:hypothetical protein
MATRYVRAGASGSNNGTDWTNAYTTLTGATKSRGDVIYVADGTYSGSHTFNTALSGATLITIKKATAADHGTETGWDSAFGDGVATFGDFNFDTGYWVIDGQTGGGPGSWNTGFGFKIVHSGATPLMDLSVDGDNVTVRHIELEGTLNSSGGGSIAQDAVAVRGADSFMLSYYYAHDLGRCVFFLVPAPNATIEYGYTTTYTSTEAAHAAWASNWAGSFGTHLTFRYNVITHIEGTGGIMYDNAADHNSQLRVYGNVFYRATGATWSSDANGIIGSWAGGSGEDYYNARIFHNTFIGIPGARVFTDFIIRSGDNEASNNLFYNVSAGIDYADIQTHDYSHYINSGGTHSEANSTSAASGDPFVDYVNLDFRLTANTASGLSLSAPFNVDMLGNTRTTWTRGALEFTDGIAASPSSRAVVAMRMMQN